jgi:hypothetical protein
MLQVKSAVKTVMLSASVMWVLVDPSFFSTNRIYIRVFGIRAVRALTGLGDQSYYKSSLE